MNDDHIFRHEVTVEVLRGGVTGEPVERMGGIGDTVAQAVRDALTAPCASKIRKGDYLLVKLGL